MRQKKWFFLQTVLMLLISVSTVFSQDSENIVLDDFETDAVFSSIDSFNNAIGHTPWGDSTATVELSLAEVERDGEMSSVLAINYDIPTWGGFTHALTDGENWVSQDWTAYNALRFWLYGSNTGGIIQFEIFDNRNPNANNDTAERWFYRIPDDFEGWQQFTIPFDSFQRRTDWQPGSAPNDGLGLDEVSGYAIGLPVGTAVMYLDDVELITLEVQPVVIDDFEIDALTTSQDDFGNNLGYVTWADTQDRVELRLVEAVRANETTQALVVDYDIETFGGFSHIFTDGTNWTTQDWTQHNAMSFLYMGSNTGAEVQFEIFDNRNPDQDGDSAERWVYRFVDDSFGWKQVEIPFIEFERREDWQPDGAPDDGLNLNAVSGYAMNFPVGVGSNVAIIDEIRLILMAGVDMPEGVVISDDDTQSANLPAVTLPEVEPNPELLVPMEYADPMMLADFENGMEIIEYENTLIGFVPWGDMQGNALLSNALIPAFTRYALSQQDDFNHVLRIDYNISAYGGFNQMFTDGEIWVSQDWTNHNAFRFWLYGTNTGQRIQVELLDNLAPNSTGDTAERYIYWMLDDFEGWHEVTIPFAFFQRRDDWQPAGAPDDGFGLNEIYGYAIGLPQGVGSQTTFFDNAQVVVVDDPSQVTVLGQAEETIEVEVDESITWDSRSWELLWSDEFDAEANTPINDEFWTCEVGDEWFNNELQAYTRELENVAHDGNGNLVITAMGNDADGYTSGRCITQGKVEFTYGRVEARIQIPAGQGIWPAFWMLGANIGQVNWPASGEIDIMENVGYEPNIVHGTIHGPGYSGGNGIGKSYESDTAFSEDFHVYAIDWNPYVIRWYVDGELYNTISVNDLYGHRWVFNDDFFILLNVAVGGDWPGYPDETTEFPQSMLIDYVRVYQLASE